MAAPPARPGCCVQDKPLDTGPWGWWGQGQRQAHPDSSLPPCRSPAPPPRGEATPAASPLAPWQRASQPAPSLPSQASVPRPSYGGFSFPPHPPRRLRPPRATGSAVRVTPGRAITTGRAVTLQQTSPLSPATNQGQAAALLDRACRYVLLLLMSSPARLMGTRRRAARRDGSSAPLPIRGLLASGPAPPVAALGPAAPRVNAGEAQPGMFSPPGLLRLYL